MCLPNLNWHWLKIFWFMIAKVYVGYILRHSEPYGNMIELIQHYIHTYFCQIIFIKTDYSFTVISVSLWLNSTTCIVCRCILTAAISSLKQWKAHKYSHCPGSVFKRKKKWSYHTKLQNNTNGFWTGNSKVKEIDICALFSIWFGLASHCTE